MLHKVQVCHLAPRRIRLASAGDVYEMVLITQSIFHIWPVFGFSELLMKALEVSKEKCVALYARKQFSVACVALVVFPLVK